MRLIDANAMYERACSLEAQALDYVGKLIERDGDEVSEEWKIWSAILTERTAFKHDVFDAPTIEERKKGKWIPVTRIYKVTEEQFPNTHIEWVDATEPDEIDGVRCSECGTVYDFIEARNWCSECGADMRGENNG